MLACTFTDRIMQGHCTAVTGVPGVALLPRSRGAALRETVRAC